MHLLTFALPKILCKSIWFLGVKFEFFAALSFNLKSWLILITINYLTSCDNDPSNLSTLTLEKKIEQLYNTV